MSDARKPKMKEAAEDAPLPKPGLEDRPRPAERTNWWSGTWSKVGRNLTKETL